MSNALHKLYCSDPVLAKALFSFLYEPMTYIHRSRLAALGGRKEILDFIASTAVGWRRLNALLMDRFDLNETEIEPFGLPRHGLLFLPRLRLQTLVAYAGVTIFNRDLHFVVLKGERQRLERRLGSAIYHFGLRQAAFFQPPDLPFELEDVSGEDLLQKILNVGKFCILACLSDLPMEFQKRFLLKFRGGDRWIFPEFSEALRLDVLWPFLERLRAKIDQSGG